MRLQRQILAALRDQLAGGSTRPPEGGVALWRAFASLSRARSWQAHGPNPISYPEIEAYCRLMRLPLEPRHVAIIRAMDEAWIEHAHDQLASRNGKGPAGQKSKSPLTSALFDALFR